MCDKCVANAADKVHPVPIANRNGKVRLREGAPDVGGHVVGAFGDLSVKRSVFRRLRGEEVFQIGQHVQILVFLNEQRGGCVAQIKSVNNPAGTFCALSQA